MEVPSRSGTARCCRPECARPHRGWEGCVSATGATGARPLSVAQSSDAQMSKTLAFGLVPSKGCACHECHGRNYPVFLTQAAQFCLSCQVTYWHESSAIIICGSSLGLAKLDEKLATRPSARMVLRINHSPERMGSRRRVGRQSCCEIGGTIRGSQIRNSRCCFCSSQLRIHGIAAGMYTLAAWKLMQISKPDCCMTCRDRRCHQPSQWRIKQ